MKLSRKDLNKIIKDKHNIDISFLDDENLEIFISDIQCYLYNDGNGL